LIKELVHSNAEIICDEERLRPENSEVFRLRCDHSKLMSLTGFVPSTKLRNGLQKTIRWFSNPANLKRYKAEIYNV